MWKPPGGKCDVQEIQWLPKWHTWVDAFRQHLLQKGFVLQWCSIQLCSGYLLNRLPHSTAADGRPFALVLREAWKTKKSDTCSFFALSVQLWSSRLAQTNFRQKRSTVSVRNWGS